MPTLPDVKAYDAVVVGMGPAGSTAAYQLSRAGLSVLGLDKAMHPRYKVCGGGLSARIDRILEDDYKSVVEHTIYGIQFSYRGADPSFLIPPARSPTWSCEIGSTISSWRKRGSWHRGA